MKFQKKIFRTIEIFYHCRYQGGECEDVEDVGLVLGSWVVAVVENNCDDDHVGECPEESKYQDGPNLTEEMRMVETV